MYLYFVGQKPCAESIAEIIALSFSYQHLRESTEGNNCKEQLKDPAQMVPHPISALQKCSLPARAHQGQVRNKSPGKTSAPLHTAVPSPLLLSCSEHCDAESRLGMSGTFFCSTDTSKPLKADSKDQPLARAPVCCTLTISLHEKTK